MDIEELIDEIDSAFSSTPLNRGIGLKEAQAIDDYESHAIQKRNRESDEKQDWHRLSAVDLQECFSSLCFFDADGMRFHLPAYLIESLKNNVDEPLFHLIQLDEYAKSKLVTLNQPQIQAILQYLNWCLEQANFEDEHPTILRAINEYWKKQLLPPELT